MAVSEQNRMLAEDATKAINESPLPPLMKDNLRVLVARASEATNGMGQEEKIQAMSQSLFDLACIFVYDLIHQTKKHERSWKDVIVECRTALCVLAAIVAGLLIIRPEIANIVAAAVHGSPAE